MKRLICLVAACAALSGRSHADVVRPDTLTVYEATANWTLGTYDLTNFKFDAGTSGLTADNVMVVPDGFGFIFKLANFTVTNPKQGLTSSKGLAFSFHIADPTGMFPLTSITLDMAAPDTNNGDASAMESVSSANVNFLANRLSDTKLYTPPAAMTDVNISASVGTGMNAGAFSTLSQVSVHFTAVPEPSSVVLLGLGLAGALGLCAGARRNSATIERR